MDHDRRCGHAPQALRAVAVGDDRRHLARRALRVPGPVDGRLGCRPGPVLVEREPVTGKKAGPLDAHLDSTLPGPRILGHEHCRHLGVTDDEARHRHDRAQRPGPVGMSDRHLLGDHPAHRGAHDVRRVDPEGVEHADGIVRHVGERVGRFDRLACHGCAEQGHHVGLAGLVEPGRQADITVVEPDHVVARTGEESAEVFGPHDQLGAQAHDQEHRRIRRVAELLDLDVDSVGLDLPQGMPPCFVLLLSFRFARWAKRYGSGQQPNYLP